MADTELDEANAQVREKMHSAASAVLNAMIRNLHKKTATRVQLIDPPVDSHIAN